MFVFYPMYNISMDILIKDIVVLCQISYHGYIGNTNYNVCIQSDS